MTLRAFGTIAVLIGLALLGACAGSSAPTSPSTQAAATSSGIDAFLGTWKSSSVASSSATATAIPDGCTSLEYQVNKNADGKSGSVQFSGSCMGIIARGTGSGVLSASNVLTWNAEGTAVRGSLVCPFSFTNSTATLEGSGVRVNYNGTVCGIAVKGSELLQR